MRSAVLLLAFNRPDTTRRVFAAIRAAKPPRLYFAVDGPRAERPAEAQKCREVREVLDGVDWPCEVKTLFRDRNLGCKVGVSSAVTWFFEAESEGIIVEDDVLPEATFFDYCDELLARYRDDDRVLMIGGSNLISSRYSIASSYFLSRYTHIWGWASWRRAWRHYDAAMTDWPAWRDSDGLRRAFDGNRLCEFYWRSTFDSVHAGKIDTWDYQWAFACWRTNSLCVLPACNQISNLGFGTDATHTTRGAPSYVTESRARPLPFPLVHPNSVERDKRADRLIDKRVFGINFFSVLKQLLRDARRH